MAIYKRDIVDINLETGNIHRSFLKHSIGYLDQQADRFGIRTYRDGAPVDLSGVSVQGIFMPPQGSPISITGVQYTAVSGNEAIVVLPQACYNYDGQFTLAIKLVDSTNAITGTMRIIDGMVDNTHASGTVAPTSAVPTYQEILATYDAMVAATAATNASLANYYSDLPSSIPAGTYCIYNHVLYRCIAPIASKGAWDATKWVEAKLANDTSDLKSAIDDITSVGEYYDMEGLEITEGKYLTNSHEIDTNDAFCMTDYIEIPAGVDSITVNRYVYSTGGTEYKRSYMVFWYDENKTYLTRGRSNVTSGNLLTSYQPDTYNAKYVRINLSHYKAHNFIMMNKYAPLRYIRNKNSSDASMNDFTEPGVYYIGSALNDMPPGITSGGFLTVEKVPWDSYMVQMYATRYGLYTRLKTSGTWRSWVTYSTLTKDESLGIVGSYTGAFTAQEVITTSIVLQANTSYIVKFYKPRTGTINVYALGNDNNVKRCFSWYNEVVFTNDSTARYLRLYNRDGTLDQIDLKVFEIDSVEQKAESVPMVYRVNKNNANFGDYTSLTQCLLDLKDNHDPKVIEIWEGDYDIYQEYIDANVSVFPENDETYTDPSTQYFDFCVWVPENTHIIGKGLVRLKWMPAAGSITPKESKAVSPLNVAASCTIENVEVHCKNGRYCLHNDALGKSEYTGAVQKYINVRFYKYVNDTDPDSGTELGYRPTTGFGIDRAMHHVYENCLFVNESSQARSRSFYGHSRTVSSESESSDITLNNCVMLTNGSECVKFGNVSQNRNIHIRVLFNNCYIQGLVRSSLEGSNNNCANAFDVQYLNCGNVNMEIKDTDNPFPPKAYNTTLTVE